MSDEDSILEPAGTARGQCNHLFRMKAAPPEAGQDLAALGGEAASIAKMYIFAACRGTIP